MPIKGPSVRLGCARSLILLASSSILTHLVGTLVRWYSQSDRSSSLLDRDNWELM